MKTARLLERLVRGETAVLHESVVMVRGDGTRFEGKAAVVAMFAESEKGVSYTVVERTEGAVTVALRVEGMAGELRFVMEGDCEGERLCEVRVKTGHLQ